MDDETIYLMIADIDRDIALLKKQIERYKLRKQEIFIPESEFGYVSPNSYSSIRDDQILELRCRKSDLLKMLEENHDKKEGTGIRTYDG